MCMCDYQGLRVCAPGSRHVCEGAWELVCGLRAHRCLHEHLMTVCAVCVCEWMCTHLWCVIVYAYVVRGSVRGNGNEWMSAYTFVFVYKSSSDTRVCM